MIIIAAASSKRPIEDWDVRAFLANPPSAVLTNPATTISRSLSGSSMAAWGTLNISIHFAVRPVMIPIRKSEAATHNCGSRRMSLQSFVGMDWGNSVPPVVNLKEKNERTEFTPLLDGFLRGTK